MADGAREPVAAVPAIGLRSLTASVLGLGLTQIIGWGTTFSAISVLGTRIGVDLDLPREIVFGGITVMLVVSALLSPTFGRQIDRQGPRRQMAVGSLIAAAALVIMALATGAASFWLAWATFGIAVPMTLSNTAVPAVVQMAGPHARRAVTGLTIIAGVTSALFLPITAWLETQLGWRGTLLLYAAAHIGICLPLHLLVLPDGRPDRKPTTAGPDASWGGVLAPQVRRRAFVLIAVWSCLEGVIVWGFNMQAPDILQGLGLSLQSAIAVWMLSGPAQATARVGEFLMAGRYPIMATAIISASMAPLGFAVLLFAGASVTSASIMAVCYGVGHGLYAIARNLLPLRLFGLKDFGATLGRLTLPQNLANAAAPILFAVLLGRVGATAAVAFTVLCALASFTSVVVLTRVVAAAEAETSGGTAQ